jgi:hypothetical protein
MGIQTVNSFIFIIPFSLGFVIVSLSSTLIKSLGEIAALRHTENKAQGVHGKVRQQQLTVMSMQNKGTKLHV